MLLKLPTYYAFEQCSKIKPIMLSKLNYAVKFDRFKFYIYIYIKFSQILCSSYTVHCDSYYDFYQYIHQIIR